MHSKRVYSLDCLKAIFILMVVITHFSFTDEQRHRLLAPFWLDLAVPVFMVMTGYTFFLSAERAQISGFLKHFDRSVLGKKLTRVLLPYCICLAAEVLLLFLTGGLDVHALKASARSVLYSTVFYGGWGPGSYYPLAFLQVLLCAPLLYVFIKKMPMVATVSGLGLAVLYEVFARTYIDDALYRILGFRHLPFVLLGMALYMYGKRLRGSYLPHLAAAVGLLFLGATGYLGYSPRLFYRWTSRSLPVALLAFAVVWWALQHESFLARHHRVFRPLCEIGQASYHIFLSQMLFYGPLQALVQKQIWLCNRVGNYRVLPAALLLNCLVGYLWFRAENYLLRRFRAARPA